jgi:hypothetical protein
VWRPESGYHDTRPGTMRNFAQVLGVKRGNSSLLDELEEEQKREQEIKKALKTLIMERF